MNDNNMDDEMMAAAENNAGQNNNQNLAANDPTKEQDIIVLGDAAPQHQQLQQQQQMAQVDQDDQVAADESEGDVEYVDDDIIDELDQDDESEGFSEGFKTMKESEFDDNEQMMFDDGDFIPEKEIEKDYVSQFSLVHEDHVYSLAQVPQAPFNTFISGDGKDKCYMWAIKPKKVEKEEEEKQSQDKSAPPQGMQYTCEKLMELEGHTETVEHIKFNFDGKLCVTGGFNNVFKVWAVQENDSPMTQSHKLVKKCELTSGPSQSDDMNFVEWHPKGNAILCGGKDYMLWLMNGSTGDFLASLSGHEDEVLCAKFTHLNGGKHIISSSADKTIRVWSPIKQECLRVIKNSKMDQQFHTVDIHILQLHPTLPLVVSGDLNGKMCLSNYNTGQISGVLGQHTDSVEGIAFCLHPTSPYCVTCGMDSEIHIYMLKVNGLRQKVKGADHGGFSKVMFSQIDQQFFYASSTLGFLHMIDVRNGTIMRTYYGHQAQINNMIEVKEHNLLVTAGDDFVCNVYDLSKQPQSYEKLAAKKKENEAAQNQ